MIDSKKDRAHRQNSYGKGVALAAAAKRENDAISILKSSNKLSNYAPMVCIYIIISFIGWYTMWYLYYGKFNTICYVSKTQTLDKLDPKFCPYYDIKFDLESFELISHTTSGVFASLIVIHLIQLLDTDTRTSYRVHAVYCTLLINIVAFLTHFSMARGWFPIIISVWGRISHLARWGEWLSVAPALMIMMHSINIRSEQDTRLLWESTILQTVSVFLGAICSFTQNLPVAFILLFISVVFYCHIYYVVYRAYKSYLNLLSTNNLKKMKLFQNSKINKESNKLRRNVTTKAFHTLKSQSVSPRTSIPATPSKKDSGTSTPIHEKESINQKEDVSTRQIVEEFEMIGSVISIKLAVYCSVTWTGKVFIYGLGVVGLISNTSESILQSVFDCISKGLYARVLCSNHVTSLSPEGILGRMLYMEEQANASIRQFLRFVFHEVATPLNTLTMSLNALRDEDLPPDVIEIITIAREGCFHINETLNDLLNFQEVEEGGLVLTTAPLHLKDLVRKISDHFIPSAKARGISLLRSIDSRIPDIVMGEKMRLRQVLIILIQQSMDNAKSECVISAQLINSDNLTAQIRIAIRDDSDGYTMEEIDNLFHPYNNLSTGNESTSKSLGMSLCVAKQIIELHGGVLTVDSTIGEGVTFNCDILFSIPSTDNIDNDTNSTDYISPNITKYPFFLTTPKPKSKDLTLELLNQTSQKLKIEGIPKVVDTVIDDSSSKFESSNQSINELSLTSLIVDDSVSFRKVFQKSLEKLGLIVEIVTDGDELLSKVINEKGICKTYDVIFLDNNMPKLNGVDAVKILRANNYDGLVIGVTGNVLKEDVDEFKLAGCNEVLPKPVDQKILKKAMISLGLHL